ncbi:hypothetical protein, partial [Serratia rubidaea]|uniref:hypothetical protein n=1 Tax=Serratia rubidaea TaxID=61652 RepID=UPI0024326DE0
RIVVILRPELALRATAVRRRQPVVRIVDIVLLVQPVDRISGDGKDRSGLPDPDDGAGNGRLKHKAGRIRKIFPAFFNLKEH